MASLQAQWENIFSLNISFVCTVCVCVAGVYLLTEVAVEFIAHFLTQVREVGLLCPD